MQAALWLILAGSAAALVYQATRVHPSTEDPGAAIATKLRSVSLALPTERAAATATDRATMSPEALPTLCPAPGDGYATPAAAFDPEVIARQYLAQLHCGSPSDFTLSRSGTGRIPVAGDWVWFAKFLDIRSDDIVGAYVDAAGQAFGNDEYRRRQEAAQAHLSPFERKADQGLIRYLERERPARNELVPVAIWLVADTTAAVRVVRAAYPQFDWIDGAPSPPQGRTISRDLAREVRAALYTAKQSGFVAAEEAFKPTIASLGGKPGYGSTSVPLLFAEVPAGALETLAAFDVVIEIGLNADGWREGAAPDE
jgi:hypothetical protein